MNVIQTIKLLALSDNDPLYMALKNLMLDEENLPFEM